MRETAAMHRWTALGLVFFASAAILVLEIMAGRMLAPYLGVTLETFTGIIGTVLAGISIGAWLGGRLADKRDPGTLLGPLLIAGGAFTLLSPTLVRWIGPTVRAAGPIEIVLASAVGFFIPALVLSAVAPAVVKMQLQDLGQTGEVVGGFSAMSSAGAIFGTFVTGFVLIAAAPSQTVILVVGAALLALGGFAWFKYGRIPGRHAMLSVVALGVVGSGIVTITPTPCETETAYFCARVEADEDRPSGRSLWLDTLRHSYIDLEDPTHLEFRYAKIVGDVLAALPDGPLRTLYVGGGGFTFPGYISATRPGSTHLVLELDSSLVDIAERELGLVLGEDLLVEVGDARLRINQAPRGAFDFVLGDAFGGPSVPWHLTTEEFLTEVAARLTDAGLYVMNLIDYPPHGFARAELATVAAVFPHVLVIAPRPYLDAATGGNFVLVGSKVPITAEAVMANTIARNGIETVLGNDAARAWIGDAAVLRDDFAPVDQLMSR
jgi:spermidine synthase